MSPGPVAGADGPEFRRVLAATGDIGLRRALRAALQPIIAVPAGSADELLAHARSGERFPVVVLDLDLPHSADGLALLSDLLHRLPRTKAIALVADGDRDREMAAVAQGAADVFLKPVDLDVLRLVVERGLRLAALEEAARVRQLSTPGSANDMIHASSGMAGVKHMIERAGPADVTVLILGESGTGKEVVARALHRASRRRDQPFVAINCASIPETLLESELFGHERGAFTGATKRTHGKLELAHRGTLFLDEVGDMPMALQVKLLRFLQERKIERLGGRQSIDVDVRVISATNSPLDRLIVDGGFREDLFYRLNEIRIELPPLRTRDHDVVILAHRFLATANQAYDRALGGFSEDALAAMTAYPWPGNVRELESRIKRAVVMSEGRVVSAADLGLSSDTAVPRSLDLRTETGRLEQALVQEALAVANGNMSRAAKLLGISRPQLYHLKRARSS